jgi:hypothetical protein
VTAGQAPTRFDREGNSVANWAFQAAGMLNVATFLEKQFWMSTKTVPPGELGFHALRASLLLRAFGLECLLKALWLARGNPLAKAGRYVGIPKLKNQHDLLGLADRVGVFCSLAERETLARLTMFGELGRYPIPKDATREAPGRQWGSLETKHARAVANRTLRLLSHESKGR